MAEFTPEKYKQIALARLDIVHKWLEFRKQSQNKLQADYDFVKLHNTSNSHFYEILGKISRGSLHRWLAMLNGTEDYTKLLPQYKYSTVQYSRIVLNDEEIKQLVFIIKHFQVLFLHFFQSLFRCLFLRLHLHSVELT